ncbi:MAG: hypothetical protein JEZ04_05935 [Spirochaetales bacterium]|nr:hypothetical protein [Spirochaetales bacterium]
MKYIFIDMPVKGKVRTFIKILTILTLLMVCAGGVFADDFTWDGGGPAGRWTAQNNWYDDTTTTNDGYPDGADDTATIAFAETINVGANAFSANSAVVSQAVTVATGGSFTTVGALTVNTGGNIAAAGTGTITAGNVLTVNGTGALSVVDGNLSISVGGATLTGSGVINST